MPKGSPAFDKFTDARIAANDAMIALLVGTRLGASTIKDLELEKDRLLTSAFDEGDIKGIGRFNLKTDDALNILDTADNHLAYMAIPYAIAIYERYVRDVIQKLKSENYSVLSEMTDSNISDLKLEKMLNIIVAKYNLQISLMDQALFSIIRQIRNRIIHSGGSIGSHIMTEYRSMPEEYRDEWVNLASRPLVEAVIDRKFVLGEGELFAALAICQRLVNQIDSEVNI